MPQKWKSTYQKPTKMDKFYFLTMKMQKYLRKFYTEINVENEIQGSVFTFYQDLIRLRKEMLIISEGSYKPALEDSKQVYAFERQFEDQKLLVLNNFYATEVGIDLPAAYQNGQILISNYEDVEVSEKIILKPYQTLAIYVN